MDWLKFSISIFDMKYSVCWKTGAETQLRFLLKFIVDPRTKEPYNNSEPWLLIILCVYRHFEEIHHRLPWKRGGENRLSSQDMKVYKITLWATMYTEYSTCIAMTWTPVKEGRRGAGGGDYTSDTLWDFRERKVERQQVLSSIKISLSLTIIRESAGK